MKLNRLSLLIFGNVALCGALACAFVVPTSAAAGSGGNSDIRQLMII
jgi:hypothetical protein